MPDRKPYTKPTLRLIDLNGNIRPKPSDINKIAQVVWRKDIPIYDQYGQRYRFDRCAEIVNLLCGPASAWSLSPVAQANDSTASDEAHSS